jgi:site-specific DNA recombinase
LVSLTEKIDTTTASGNMVFRLMAVLNEFERDLVGDRTSEAMRHKKSKRQAYSRPVFGFDRIGDELEVNEEEQEVVGLLKKLRSKNLSYQAIAQELNSRCIPTKRGGRRWYDSIVRNILMNDIHTQVSNG